MIVPQNTRIFKLILALLLTLSTNSCAQLLNEIIDDVKISAELTEVIYNQYPGDYTIILSKSSESHNNQNTVTVLEIKGKANVWDDYSSPEMEQAARNIIALTQQTAFQWQPIDYYIVSFSDSDTYIEQITTIGFQSFPSSNKLEVISAEEVKSLRDLDYYIRFQRGED